MKSASQKPSTTPDRRSQADAQSGFVLIASLLILVVLTLIQIAMSRSFWLQEMMGGNSREKARAFNAAQTALQSAESWLQKNAGATAKTCGTAEGALTTIQICSDDPASATTVPLATRFAYNSPYIPVNTAGGLGKYFGSPGYHIRFLDSTPNGDANFYRITAYGYGGNQNAVATVQSLYQIDFRKNSTDATVRNLGGL